MTKICGYDDERTSGLRRSVYIEKWRDCVGMGKVELLRYGAVV